MFAFTTIAAGLPACLICSKKLAKNKCSIEEHFQNKLSAFAEEYPAVAGKERAVSVLQWKSKV